MLEEEKNCQERKAPAPKKIERGKCVVFDLPTLQEATDNLREKNNDEGGLNTIYRVSSHNSLPKNNLFLFFMTKGCSNTGTVILYFYSTRCDPSRKGACCPDKPQASIVSSYIVNFNSVSYEEILNLPSLQQFVFLVYFLYFASHFRLSQNRAPQYLSLKFAFLKYDCLIYDSFKCCIYQTIKSLCFRYVFT